jgi:hypothetical protein
MVSSILFVFTISAVVLFTLTCFRPNLEQKYNKLSRRRTESYEQAE